jgi:DNA-binding PadR family transcriptional regulator
MRFFDAHGFGHHHAHHPHADRGRGSRHREHGDPRDPGRDPHEANRGGHRGGRGDQGFFGFGDHGRGHGFRGEAGPGGFGPGRKLGSDDLQLLLLSLLAEQPSHGYELIRLLEQRSSGYYTPSPGMVYPALTYLDEIGHTRVEADGSRKRYHLTDEGRAHLNANRPRVDALTQQLAWIGSRMENWREAVAKAGADDGSAAELKDARQSLKSAMAAKRGASTDEQRRIAAVLLRAAAEINGK